MLFLVNQSMVNIGIGTAGLVALLGYIVVFVGLIALQIVIMVVGRIMVSCQQSKKEEASAVPASATAAPAAEPKQAPGTAGEVKLYDVDEKTAAMIMAIVAHKLQKPLNELRFKSIREVK